MENNSYFCIMKNRTIAVVLTGEICSMMGESLDRSQSDWVYNGCM